jgi:hypothetical protein
MGIRTSRSPESWVLVVVARMTAFWALAASAVVNPAATTDPGKEHIHFTSHNHVLLLLDECAINRSISP